MTDEVRVDREHEHVAIVVLDRPQRANALSDDLVFNVLPKLFLDLAADPSVRVVMVAGEGRYFCAGVDLDAESFGAPDAASSELLVRKAQRAIVTLRQMPQPSIAVVDGAAVGAGLGLAVACDFRIASARARFVAPFVRMGLVPDYGCSYLLPQLLGVQKALDLVLTCRWVEADEAAALGLVDRVVADPMAAALEFAELIARNPPGAVAAARRNLYQAALAGLERIVIDYEPPAVAIALHSAEFKERFAEYRAGLTQTPPSPSGDPAATSPAAPAAGVG